MLRVITPWGAHGELLEPIDIVTSGTALLESEDPAVDQPGRKADNDKCGQPSPGEDRKKQGEGS